MNYEELNRVIDESGLKRSYIAVNIGMTPKVFYDRTQGISKWKVDEAQAFSKLLKLTKAQRDNIFLP